MFDPATLRSRRDALSVQRSSGVARVTSRRKVVEATGYDVEEVDRETATDTARAEALGLRYRTSPGETQGARATPATLPDPGDEANGDSGDAAATDRATNQE